MNDPTKVFHSFRHNFIDALRLAGADKEINSALVGHADGSPHGNYGAREKALRFRHRLAEAVTSVAYEGLDLSRLRTTGANERGRRGGASGATTGTSGQTEQTIGKRSASGEHRSGAISTVGPAVALFRQLSLPR